ncbi:exodeoxyribonuclease V subunit beta [Thioploca ingrica]|uniref:RecBCD enzyme subunit RecB n=1 Tax=Thioploca ingrica TaxID=40754 RepID=A0A090BUD8_9GAMM|nr:exodeoxyribonuclease V subunit beta [Thioploca ingrica]
MATAHFPIESLDPISIPLQGINLIEASAGTGKTYTITTLFIRLILEKKLLINRILVVTFTEAATEELRDRIRRRLYETLLAFQQGQSQDPVLTRLIQQYTEPNEAILRLKNALRGFDEAAIFTIHSFCRQMLQGNAFESGVLFDTELVSDQAYLLREIVEDFWRQHFYQASPLWVSYLLNQGYHQPSKLLKILNYGQYVGQPFLNKIPQIELPVTAAKEFAFYTAFTAAQQTWQGHSAQIEELLLQDTHLNGTKYKKSSIPQWCKAVARFLNAPWRSIQLPDKWIKFTQAELINSVKQGKTAPQHIFFEQSEQLWHCQQALAAGFEQQLLALKIKLFTVAEQALAQKKHQHHIQSFDDLLLNLYRALTTPRGHYLTQLIRYKYHAALIDEFQDTDPVQYDIFRTLYGAGSDGLLFLIGDPKQAIYSFRGADIFTYMAACRDAQQHYTLATNWRSEPNLIQAVNQLFAKVAHPFMFAAIPFQPVQAPAQQQLSSFSNRLKIENKYLPPLQIWFVPRQLAHGPPDKPINKSWAKQQIPLTVANEIARLLMLGQLGQALIGDKPVVAGDIAVLVRTHAQAQRLQKVLTQLQIPSVLYSRDSLFASHEIREIERLLLAIADPSDEGLIKSALTTDMLGLSGHDLYQLLDNENAWQTYLNRFQYYHFLWQHVGFIQMYRTLLMTEQVQSRLLTYPDGERRLTNVLHAAELLQQVTVQQNRGISGLCQWLAQQRAQAGTIAEEQQLRLESDEKRVKIVTIHKSKGLEYPIVFCPFVWDGYLYSHKAEPLIFHNEQEQLTLDLGSLEQEHHRQRAAAEERAENLRLFYVAVTRAKHRCYLIWGAFRDAGTSALAHLLHPGKVIEETDDATLWQDLHHLASQAEPAIQLAPLPTDHPPYQRQREPTAKLRARYFKGHIDKTWRVASFTALSSPATVTDTIEKPDYDEFASNRSSGINSLILSDKSPIFNFPRGARAGSFMHALFEKLDFTQPEMKLVTEQLAHFNYEVDQWHEVIVNWVTQVIGTPLEPQRPTFTLSQISLNHRLNELEFYYPLAPITSQGLQTLFAEFGTSLPLNSLTQHQTELQFLPVQGLMKGFIDMVFEYEGRYYLVDYKSNLLGTQMHAYHHSQLNAVIIKEAYWLQYHIYVVALHRYLANRLSHYRYEDHFGGVYYLFLRGMRPQWGAHYGIYRDLPSVKLIEKLSAYFDN